MDHSEVGRQIAEQDRDVEGARVVCGEDHRPRRQALGSGDRDADAAGADDAAAPGPDDPVGGASGSIDKGSDEGGPRESEREESYGGDREDGPRHGRSPAQLGFVTGASGGASATATGAGSLGTAGAGAGRSATG